MIRLAWLLLFTVACARNGSAEQPAPAPQPETPARTAPPPVEHPASTPAELYAECRDRVEGPEADGECTSDDDCVRVGCGSEVCTTVTAGADLVTTCEDRVCFHVLDTCGCHDGRCTWTLLDEVPDLPTIQPLGEEPG